MTNISCANCMIVCLISEAVLSKWLAAMPQEFLT